MKKNLLLLALTAFYFSPGFCQLIYTSTVQAGFNYNPGAGVSGTPIIVLDDVQIPSALVQGTDSVRITKINFGILRGASAPATTVSFYYTVIDTNATTYPDLITVPPVLIGSVDLPANGASNAGGLITFGDSINTLFSVVTDTGYLYTGAQTLFLGLSFSNDDGLNGWALTIPGAPESENEDVMWKYDVDATPAKIASYFGGPPQPSATFYLEVYGKGFSTVPVTLATFNARRAGKINQLNWSTEQELNTRYFVVERSNNGRNYSSIGQLNAAGNSSSAHNYAFSDNNPVKGINYYRLRTIDKDNSSRLSAIRSIRNAGIADVSIYPNPVTDRVSVTINSDKATAGSVTISDVNGKLIYSGTVKLPAGNTVLPINVNNAAAGSYIMKIQLDDDVIVKKFNKQ